MNACGGCVALANDPGEACGRCGLDEFICDANDPDNNTTVCDGDTRLNACGGCSSLLNEPQEVCGPCELDEFVCDPDDPDDDSTVCSGETFGNACEGCAPLANPPGDPCGRCGLDEYVCDPADVTRNSTICAGDTAGNACGGCTPFDEIRGAVCSRDGNGDAATVFRDTRDPDYATLVEMARAGERNLARIKRFDMPGFQPMPQYLREMKNYGVLPPDHPDDAPVDPYDLDQKYWSSLWHQPKVERKPQVNR